MVFTIFGGQYLTNWEVFQGKDEDFLKDYLPLEVGATLSGLRRRNHGVGSDQWKLRAMADY